MEDAVLERCDLSGPEYVAYKECVAEVRRRAEAAPKLEALLDRAHALLGRPDSDGGTRGYELAAEIRATLSPEFFDARGMPKAAPAGGEAHDG